MQIWHYYFVTHFVQVLRENKLFTILKELEINCEFVILVSLFSRKIDIYGSFLMHFHAARVFECARKEILVTQRKGLNFWH